MGGLGVEGFSLGLEGLGLQGLRVQSTGLVGYAHVLHREEVHQLGGLRNVEVLRGSTGAPGLGFRV